MPASPGHWVTAVNHLKEKLPLMPIARRGIQSCERQSVCVLWQGCGEVNPGIDASAALYPVAELHPQQGKQQ